MKISPISSTIPSTMQQVSLAWNGEKRKENHLSRNNKRFPSFFLRTGEKKESPNRRFNVNDPHITAINCCFFLCRHIGPVRDYVPKNLILKTLLTFETTTSFFFYLLCIITILNRISISIPLWLLCNSVPLIRRQIFERYTFLWTKNKNIFSHWESKQQLLQ